MNSRKDIYSKQIDLNFMNIENFSSFDKPLIVIAYLLRFPANLKNGLNKERINLGKETTIDEKSFVEHLCRLCTK